MSSELLDHLATAARSYQSIAKVILFGSRARGSYHRTSDYDICVYCEDEKDFIKYYFDVDDIDTFYKIDVLHYEALSNDALKQEILTDGIVLYERE